ncbi:hypothetical protein Ddye_029086 [Dipteronia dyeriana]|uniref:Sec-independent protein translocase protein TatB n=1 Tax=Dipteronia dyeriana TaxID=168575 RepID=A0AAD9TEW9_9ROSI|nr:hypothetical protein Ddye_029086 [Dipteronia dyeriana]
MLGISYGELFLIIGAAAALVGPKDLPIIARTAGRLAGRAIGYVQLARGQFDNVMQQSQARQVQKELQDAMQQLEAIRHEILDASFINPGPLTRKLMGSPLEPTLNLIANDNSSSEKSEGEQKSTVAVVKCWVLSIASKFSTLVNKRNRAGEWVGFSLVVFDSGIEEESKKRTKKKMNRSEEWVGLDVVVFDSGIKVRI